MGGSDGRHGNPHFLYFLIFVWKSIFHFFVWKSYIKIQKVMKKSKNMWNIFWVQKCKLFLTSLFFVLYVFLGILQVCFKNFYYLVLFLLFLFGVVFYLFQKYVSNIIMIFWKNMKGIYIFGAQVGCHWYPRVGDIGIPMGGCHGCPRVGPGDPWAPGNALAPPETPGWSLGR